MNSAFTCICVCELLSLVFLFLPHEECKSGNPHPPTPPKKKKEKEKKEAKLGICIINIMYQDNLMAQKNRSRLIEKILESWDIMW